MTKVKYHPGPDGKFHCDVEGCEQPPYELPQHLGLHKFHKHGIKSTQSRYKPKTARRYHPGGNGDKPLTAEEICQTVLLEVAPNGMIPVLAIEDYRAWVEATRSFLARLP